MAIRSRNVKQLAAVGLLALSVSVACARFAGNSTASNSSPAAQADAPTPARPTTSSRITGPNTVPVKRDDVVETVTLDAVVVPTSQETVTYPRQGAVDQIDVKAGQTVKQGDPILELQSADIQRNLDGARDHLASSQSALAQGQALAAAAQKAAADQAVADQKKQQDQIANLQVKLQQAQENLAKVQAGPSVYDRDVQNTAIQKGQTEVASAQADKNALMAGPTAEDLGSAQRDLSAKQTALKQAQSDLDTLTKGTDPGSIRAAQAALQRAQSQLQLAQASKPDPKIDPATAQLQHDIAIQDAQSAVVNAQSALDRLKEPPSDVAVTVAKQKVADAQAAADTAQSKLDALNAGPTPEQIAAADAAISAAQHYLAEASQNAATVLNHPTPSELADAQRQVQQAQTDLDNARNGQPVSTAPVGPDLNALQAAVDKDQQSVDKLVQQLADTHLTAPFDGTVISIKVKSGDTINSSKPVLVLAHAGTPLVRAELDDSVAAKIAAGQHALVDTGTPGAAGLAAVVSSVTPAGASNGASAQFQVTWPDAGAPKLGLPVQATVTLNQKQDVLVVPKTAVRKLGDRSTVEVQDGTVRRMVNVQVGIVTADTAEIVSGLSEGQLVVTPTATK
jgi:multidrug efflux pump subunit AcrA (membrane-fusion protein)